jgi:hypothetical protein
MFLKLGGKNNEEKDTIYCAFATSSSWINGNVQLHKRKQTRKRRV